MEKFTVVIKDPIGLHARPASILVSTASKFQSNIVIKNRDRTANLKSIMNVMALGIRLNDQVAIEADGEDEAEAIESIKKVMKSNNLV